MNTLSPLTPARLRIAAGVAEQIEKLKIELAALMGGNSSAPVNRGPGRPPREVSISAPKTKRRKMSAAGRARLIAAMRARWAKAKAAGKTSL
jgi:hypothetical protein